MVTAAPHEQSILVYGGFMEVGDNKVLVLADTAERAEEVDVERAEAARRRAEESIAGRRFPAVRGSPAPGARSRD